MCYLLGKFVFLFVFVIICVGCISTTTTQPAIQLTNEPTQGITPTSTFTPPPTETPIPRPTYTVEPTPTEVVPTPTETIVIPTPPPTEEVKKHVLLWDGDQQAPLGILKEDIVYKIDGKIFLDTLISAKIINFYKKDVGFSEASSEVLMLELDLGESRTGEKVNAIFALVSRIDKDGNHYAFKADMAGRSLTRDPDPKDNTTSYVHETEIKSVEDTIMIGGQYAFYVTTLVPENFYDFCISQGDFETLEARCMTYSDGHKHLSYNIKILKSLYVDGVDISQEEYGWLPVIYIPNIPPLQ
jgi:hypothetical protein